MGFTVAAIESTGVCVRTPSHLRNLMSTSVPPAEDLPAAAQAELKSAIIAFDQQRNERRAVLRTLRARPRDERVDLNLGGFFLALPVPTVEIVINEGTHGVLEFRWPSGAGPGPGWHLRFCPFALYWIPVSIRGGASTVRGSRGQDRTKRKEKGAPSVIVCVCVGRAGDLIEIGVLEAEISAKRTALGLPY